MIRTDPKKLHTDGSANAQVTVDYPHHEIHDGNHYFVENYATLDSGSTLVFGFTTPSAPKECHMLWEIESNITCTFEIGEDATLVSGSASTPFNSNRNSNKISSASIVVNPTVSASGNLISAAKWGSATQGGQNLAGGGVGRIHEIILKSNSTYMFRITSGEDGNVISYVGLWYEHTPKNT